MIIDSHQHVMLPTQTQLDRMDQAGITQAILFTTTPHVERAAAATLADIGAEMQVLSQLLGGTVPFHQRVAQMEATILELKAALDAAPHRFYGFGPVPLGLSQAETAQWIQTQVVDNAFLGVGEITPGNEAQVRQLEPLFQALTAYDHFPLWVHTFSPVTGAGIQILMDLCRRYPSVPVIWGHMGGTHWMEVISFAKAHKAAYLDLSAAFTPLSVKTALTELPHRCLFGSDAPFGEPFLARQMVEFVSPSPDVTALAFQENIRQLLQL